MIPKVTLSSLFQIGSSKRVLKSQWRDSGVPFYRGREVTKLSQDGYVENELFIDEELYKELYQKYGVPTQGDIVVTAIGTIGNTYIVREDDKFYFKDASVLWLKKNSDVVSEYINYWFKSSLMREQLEVGNGATVDTLTISKLQSLIVPLPSLAEQKRIVAILDQAFADIDQARATAEANLKNTRELFDSYLQQVFGRDSDDWSRKELQSVCRLINGRAYKKEEMLNEGKYPLLRVGNFFTNRSWYYSDLELDDDKYCDNGDLLYAWSASFGPRIWDGEKTIYHYHIWKVEENKELIIKDFLYYWFKWDADNVKKEHGAGATMVHVSMTSMNIRKICYPSKSEQEQIVEFLKELEIRTGELTVIYQRKLNNLDELKKSILQKAFAGELTKGKGIAA